MKRKFLETYLAQGTGLSMHKQIRSLDTSSIAVDSAMIPTVEVMDMAKNVRMILKNPHGRVLR